MTTTVSSTPAVAVGPVTQTSATPKDVTVPTIFLSPPPDVSTIPSPPDDYVAATPGEFRVAAPRKSELAALPQAVLDLQNFTDYSMWIGGAGPSEDEVVDCFDLARQWSTMRTASAKWNAYCVLQEGLAWQALRGIVGRLGPAYALAMLASPKLATRFPGLTSLLHAKRTIAKKGASTRAMNKAAEAMGEPPSHGEVGKRNQRRLEKAALAAARVAASEPVAKPAPTLTAPGATVVSGPRPS